jgi:hypothetical protein
VLNQQFIQRKVFEIKLVFRYIVKEIAKSDWHFEKNHEK